MSCENCERLERELLSALAAIEHVRKREGCIVTDERLAQIIDNVELSALREHDAELIKKDRKSRPQPHFNAEVKAYVEKRITEVRQPLVELLRSVHTWFMQQAPKHYNGCGLWIDVDAELSEHPRENCILDVDSPTDITEREEYLQCGCVNCRDALAKVKEGQ